MSIERTQAKLEKVNVIVGAANDRTLSALQKARILLEALTDGSLSEAEIGDVLQATVRLLGIRID